MNLPTKITFIRIVSTIILIVALFIISFIEFAAPELFPGSKINLIFFIVFLFFILASYTDHLDGKIARTKNMVTDLGKFLDPVADKLLINSMVIFLIAPGIFAQYSNGLQTISFNLWCAIILIARDIVIDALRFIGAQKKVVIAANVFGKLKTVLEMIAISLVLLNDFPFHYIYGNSCPKGCTVTDFMVYIATFVSVISGIIYVIQNRKVFLENGNN